MEPEEQLAKRNWLVSNMNLFMKEVIFHRTHKDNFLLPKYILWEWDKEEGHVDP